MTNNSKVLFATNLLCETAFEWMMPYVENEHPMLNSFSMFEEMFLITFGDINQKREAEFEILELHQGRHFASSYISDFQHLSTELGWSGAPLISMFYKRLNNKIKSALCNYSQPESLGKIYKLVAQIDDHQNELCHELNAQRKFEHHANDEKLKDTQILHNPSNEEQLGKIQYMVIGSFRGPIAQEERKRYFRE